MNPERSVLPVMRRTEVALVRALTLAAAGFTTVWVLAVGGWILVSDPFGGGPFPLSLVATGLTLMTLSWWAVLLQRRALTAGAPAAQERLLRHSTWLMQGTAAAVLPAGLAWNALLLFSPDSVVDGAILPVRWLVTLAVTSALFGLATTSRVGVTWTYLAAVQSARIVLFYVLPVDDPVAAFIALMQSIASSMVVVAAVHDLRQVAASVDRALERNAREAVRTASLAAAGVEAARIDGLVHDHILAALLIASRADHAEDAPMVRRSAAGALAALSEIVAPVDDDLGDGPGAAATRTPAEFAEELFARVRDLDPDIECRLAPPSRGRPGDRRPGAPTLTLTPQAATAVAAAALEAVRNSLRHAAGPAGPAGAVRPVRRTVTVAADPTTLRVTVADDGVGFDPATAPQGRYGVSGSIVGRMNGLEGGHARLRTRIDRGTRVELTLEPPRDPARHGAQETAEVPWRGGLLHEFRPGVHLNPTLAWASSIHGYRPSDVRVGSSIVAVLATALAMVAMATVSQVWIDPLWLSHATIGIAVLVCAMLAWRWGVAPLHDIPLASAIVFAVLGPLLLALTLAGWQGDAGVAAFLWTVSAAYLVPVVLGLSNYPLLTWLSGLASALVLGIWSLVVGGPDAFWSSAWWMLAALPALVNGIQHSSVRSIARAASVSLGMRSRIDAQARTAAAEDARRLNARRVDSLARPLLERLAAGERTLPPVRVEAALLEARLRDDLRARCFRNTEVIRAAHDARARGLHVELLDDGALEGAPGALREHVISEAVAALDAAVDGAVVVRVAPPGRDLAATVLTRPETDAPTRVEIPAAGWHGAEPADEAGEPARAERTDADPAPAVVP